MNFNIRTDYVGTGDLICDAVVEQSVEADFTIPDYRPEVFKIIKTIAEPILVQRLAVGTRATVEGYVKLTVIYGTADDRRIYSAAQKLPFSKQIDMKEAAGDGCIVLCDAEVSYFNCRAVNSRRIDARGAVTLAVKVMSQKGEEVVISADNAGVHCRRSETEFVRLSAQNEKQFSINESLAVDAEGRDELSVLRCDAAATVSGTELVAGRVSVTGAVTVTLAVDLSDGEDYRVRRLVYNLPFNQLVELDVADDFTSPIARVSVISCTAESASGGIVDISISCAAEVYGFETDATMLLSDVFSTEYEIDCKVKSLPLTTAVYSINQPFSISKTLDKPAGRLIDYFLSSDAPHIESNGEAATIFGTASLCCIVCDENGDLQTFERPVEYIVEAGNILIHGVPVTMLETLFSSVECADTDTAINLRADGYISGMAADSKRMPAIVSAKFDPDSKKTRDTVAMSVYYAEPGEDVWSIAKAFNTSPSAVAVTNGIAEDEAMCARTMLVVPIVS